MAYTNEHVLKGWEKYFAALSANDDVGEYDDNFKAEIHQEFTLVGRWFTSRDGRQGYLGDNGCELINVEVNL